MLVFGVLATVALLLLFAFGQIFPNKVFLGPTATRQKVIKFYGPPALIGFIVLTVIAPSDPGAAPALVAKKPKGPTAVPKAVKGRVLSVSFGGLTLPGRIGDAKATGFTDCTADYYSYKCKRAVLTELLGLKAQSAELAMTGSDYFADTYLTPVGPSGDVRELKPEQLAYGDVVLTFSRPDYDLNCTDKYREKHGGYDQPANCLINKNTIAHVNQALLDAGWTMYSSKGGYYHYVRAGEQVEITTKHETATIRRVSAEHVSEVVAREASRQNARETANVNAAAVLEQMKK
jgi:hypothetical protein